MLKNIIKVLISNFSITLVGIINSFAFPLLMSINEYAYYHEFLLYISYIQVCHLGIPTGMYINYAGKNYADIEKKRYGSEMVLLFRTLIAFTIVGLVISIITNAFLAWAITFSIFPVCLNSGAKALYQAWGRFTEYSIINAIPNIGITVSALLMYFITGEMSVRFVIASYILLNFLISIWFLREFYITEKGIKRDKLLTKENIQTSKTGFSVMIGNYMNNIFHAVDKQFVSIFYSSTSFAMYSFAMSTQNLMTVLITSIAQPFYPRLAKGDVDKREMNMIKELLFIFGSMSGIVFFAIKYVVQAWIPKYTDSLHIVEIFFMVFPAMAVINVIYINLYKITKQIKKYLLALVFILITAALLNAGVVLIKGNYYWIAIATLAAYYIWLLVFQRDFENLSIDLKDYIYLLGFAALYCATVFFMSPILGALIYGVLIFCWDIIFYRESIRYMFSHVLRKGGNKG